MSKQVKIVGGVTTVEGGVIRRIEDAMVYGIRGDTIESGQHVTSLSFDALLALNCQAARLAESACSGSRPPQPDSLICGAGPGYRPHDTFEDYWQLTSVFAALLLGAIFLAGLAGADSLLAHAGWALGAFFSLVGSGIMVLLYLEA